MNYFLVGYSGYSPACLGCIIRLILAAEKVAEYPDEMVGCPDLLGACTNPVGPVFVGLIVWSSSDLSNSKYSCSSSRGERPAAATSIATETPLYLNTNKQRGYGRKRDQCGRRVKRNNVVSSNREICSTQQRTHQQKFQRTSRKSFRLDQTHFWASYNILMSAGNSQRC